MLTVDEIRPVKLRFDNNRISMETATGDVLSQPLEHFPILSRATPEQREEYSFNVWGIRWEEIDEDISFESFTWPATIRRR